MPGLTLGPCHRPLTAWRASSLGPTSLPGRSVRRCSTFESHPLPCPTLQALFTLKENCLFCSQSSAEQKDLSDSGEEPRGEAEAPHHGTGHPESAGEHALELPVPASALARAPEAQLLPFPRELAGVSPPPPGIPQPGAPNPDQPLPLGPYIQTPGHQQLATTEKMTRLSSAPFNSRCQKVSKEHVPFYAETFLVRVTFIHSLHLILLVKEAKGQKRN